MSPGLEWKEAKNRGEMVKVWVSGANRRCLRGEKAERGREGRRMRRWCQEEDQAEETDKYNTDMHQTQDSGAENELSKCDDTLHLL